MKSIEEMSFEEALAELEGLVRRLEEGRLPLEEAIQAYERGASLRKHCETRLQAARLKVDQVVMNADGSTKTQPFTNE